MCPAAPPPLSSRTPLKEDAGHSGTPWSVGVTGAALVGDTADDGACPAVGDGVPALGLAVVAVVAALLGRGEAVESPELCAPHAASELPRRIMEAAVSSFPHEYCWTGVRCGEVMPLLFRAKVNESTGPAVCGLIGAGTFSPSGVSAQP